MCMQLVSFEISLMWQTINIFLHIIIQIFSGQNTSVIVNADTELVKLYLDWQIF